MEVTINLGVMITVIATIVGVLVCAVLLLAFLKLNDILKQVRGILGQNEENISESLERLPRVLQNVEEITERVNEDMNYIGGALKNIEETVEHTASAAQVLNEDIVLPIKDLLEIFAMRKGIFIKEKKKGFLSR